jgi:hypothetical protein
MMDEVEIFANFNFHEQKLGNRFEPIYSEPKLIQPPLQDQSMVHPRLKQMACPFVNAIIALIG